MAWERSVKPWLSHGRFDSCVRHQAPVAQWTEHFPPEEGVARSSRAERTTAVWLSGIGARLQNVFTRVQFPVPPPRPGSSADRAASS